MESAILTVHPYQNVAKFSFFWYVALVVSRIAQLCGGASGSAAGASNVLKPMLHLGFEKADLSTDTVNMHLLSKDNTSFLSVLLTTEMNPTWVNFSKSNNHLQTLRTEIIISHSQSIMQFNVAFLAL